MLATESRPVRRKLLGAAVHNDDATLVRRTQSGEEQAFAAIFERHHAPLLSYCRHMLGNRDDGEDALQQAFIKAHRALLGGTTPRDLRPWLYAIARNCCLSAIAARRPTAPLEDRTPGLAGLSDEVRRREDLRELLDGIGRLPEDQRSALLLAELDDLSHQAIATVLGCPVSKVKALVYQARSALIADRDARETPCQEIREQLAVARGGELRRGPLRRHLNLCSGCRDFQFAVGAQRQSLAALLPVAPSAGLMAAVLGHGSAHAVGAAAIGGGGAGAGATSGGGAAGTGVGVTSCGGSATGASGIVTSGTTAAMGTAASTGTATGAGTGVGALVGGGLVTKLAVGGAVVALAAAGTVATRQRPAAAGASRLGGARNVAFAAGRSEAAGGAGSRVSSYGGAAPIAGSVSGLPGTRAQESATALSDTSGPGALAGVDPFTAPTSGAGAQTLLTLTGASPSNMALTTLPRQLAVGEKATGDGSLVGRNAQARKLRAKLRREARRRRALRLREARRRARLRKERSKALRRRRRVAAKPVKAAKSPTTPVTPAPVRIRHRHAAPSSTSLDTAGSSSGNEGKQTTKVKHLAQTTGTGAASTTTTSTGSKTTTGTGAKKGKTGSAGAGEKAGSTGSSGKSGPATGSENTGSSVARGKTGSGAGAEKSGPTGENRQTGTSAHTGTSHDGGQTGGSESSTGAVGASKTGDAGEHANTTTHKGETSGATGSGSAGNTAPVKKHLIQEEQLPNL
jgi:RNA polymerase sigma factor (sigma-70 family)